MTQHAETVNIPAMEATGDVTKIPMRELDAQLAEYVDYSGGELVLRRVVKVDPPHDQVMRAFAQLRSDATSDTQNILANIFDLKAGLETMKTKLDAVLIAIGKSKAEEPGTLHLTLPPGDGEIKEVEIVPEPVKKKK